MLRSARLKPIPDGRRARNVGPGGMDSKTEQPGCTLICGFRCGWLPSHRGVRLIISKNHMSARLRFSCAWRVRVPECAADSVVVARQPRHHNLKSHRRRGHPVHQHGGRRFQSDLPRAAGVASTSCNRAIRRVPQSFTAQAFGLPTDLDDNRIAALHPARWVGAQLEPGWTMHAKGVARSIVAPDGRDGMLQHRRAWFHPIRISRSFSVIRARGLLPMFSERRFCCSSLNAAGRWRSMIAKPKILQERWLCRWGRQPPKVQGTGERHAAAKPSQFSPA